MRPSSCVSSVLSSCICVGLAEGGHEGWAKSAASQPLTYLFGGHGEWETPKRPEADKHLPQRPPRHAAAGTGSPPILNHIKRTQHEATCWLRVRAPRQPDWVRMPLTSCATLEESLPLSVPHFLYPQNSDFNNASITGFGSIKHKMFGAG